MSSEMVFAIVAIALCAAAAAWLGPGAQCPYCGCMDTHPTERDSLLSSRYCNGCRRMYS